MLPCFHLLTKYFFDWTIKETISKRGFLNMSRLVALLILVLPGAVAALGIKLMRDALFGHTFAPFPSLFLQGAAGLAFFLFGLYILAGFILYRDRKRNQVSPRFRKKKL